MVEEIKKKTRRPAQKKTKVTDKKTRKQKIGAAALPIELIETPIVSKDGYLAAIGRRKESVAQVRLVHQGDGQIIVNHRPLAVYFPHFELRETIRAPLLAVGQQDQVGINVRVRGGGLRGQAEAIRLGLARVLVRLNPTFRVSLKRLGFLKRDPRVKERKKYGLKKARRAPQWAKR